MAFLLALAFFAVPIVFFKLSLLTLFPETFFSGFFSVGKAEAFEYLGAFEGQKLVTLSGIVLLALVW